jgi:ribulose-bisphosphate carboxylase large chain
VPGETDELRERHRARVEKITETGVAEKPSLPGVRGRGGVFRRADVVVSWPIENVGYNLPTLVSTLQGNLYELSQFSGLKLLDLDVPASFAERFKGPRFGIEGTRKLTGVRDRPIIGTIIKPSVGLTPQQTAELVKRLAEAGIDFVKDDELMGRRAPLAL